MTPTLPVFDPHALTEASSAMIEAAAAEAFMRDDLGGHVVGSWTYDTLPPEGRRNYRAVAVAVILAAIRETERRAQDAAP